MANQVDFKILPSDQFNVYSPQTRSEKIITYFTLLSKLRGDILAVSSQDDPNNIVAAYYSNVGNTQTLHLVKADGSEVTASNSFAGTVTSVDMSVPTGFAISGNPITTSGTLNVSFASGYSLPTNALQATWTTAYNRSITSAAVTGTSTKTLTLNQQDGGTITASWSDIDTGLTSVGLSMPSAFAVANSPLTVNGTIAVTGAGTSAQYIRGDGQLANFPSSGGGGSTINYYLNGSVNQGTFGGTTYYEMSKTPIAGAGTNFTRTSAQGPGYIASFITDPGDPSLLNIPGGNWNLEIYFNSSSSGGGPSFYGEVYKVSSSNVFTLIASNSASPEGITNGTTLDQYFTSIAVPQTTLLVTDRLAVRIYVNPDGRDITIHTEDNNFCEVITTFSTGLNALNGLTAQVQYFATGTSGTDFNIDSVTDTHTFNLPTASATNRGALSSSDWTTFNSKASDAFKTIAVAGQSNVVADSATDTLTFEAGSNIVITTDAATDKVIISAVGGGTGSVTSVDMSVPTGFAISGNPITTSGTLALAFASGYSLPTTASQGNWNTAYNDSITAFSYNTSTGVLTLTQQDAGILTATVTLQPFSTTNLTEGTNLYFTTTRARQSLSAGTGISYDNSTGVITNSAPDQIVSLTGGTGISTSGTYPSFTITNTLPDQTVVLNAGTGITTSGTYPNFTITNSDRGSSQNIFKNIAVAGQSTIIADSNDDTLTVASGTGISLATNATSDTLTITNTAPDQTVVLNAGTGISTSGTYPNFTITNTLPDQTVVLTGAGTTVVTGTYPSFTITSNDQYVGTVTSVATSAPITGGTITTSGTIGITQSGASSDGYLSSTDWNTFNAKIGGSGTTNYVAKFTGSSAIGNSSIYDNGNVGIGTSSPAAPSGYTALTIDGTSGSFTEYRQNGTALFRIGADGSRPFLYGMTNAPMDFYTNTNLWMRITAAGNVGIGTTDPQSKLHVSGLKSILSNYGVGSTQFFTYEIVTGTSSSTNQTFDMYMGRFGNGYHRVVLWGSGYGTDVGNYFDITRSWGTSSAPRIISNGGLYIGGATYTIHWVAVGNGQYDLFIKWTANMPAGYSNTISYAIQSNTGSGYTQFDYPSGVTVPTLNSSNLVDSVLTAAYNTGNVGIGTTAPAAKLDVVGVIRYGDNGSSIGALSYGTGVVTLEASSANTHVSIIPSGTGNVGIATLTPSQKLHVSGNIRVTGAYYDSGNSAGTSGQILSSTATGTAWIAAPSGGVTGSGTTNYVTKWTSGSAVGNSQIFDDGTSVGIGTASPLSKLHVETSASNPFRMVRTGGSSTNFGYEFGSGAIGLYDYTNSTYRYYITNGGNVGIGTTAPNAKLDVAGGINTRNTRVNSAEKYPVGHYSFGETVFEIDPTWTEAQLQDFFNSGGVSWTADSTAPGGYAIQIDGSANVGAGEYDSGFPYIPVDSSQDDWYYMECYIRNDAGSSIQHYMGGIDFNQNFSSLGGNPGSYTYNVMFNYNPGTSWTKVYGYWNGFGSSYGSAGTGNTNNWVSGTKYFTPQALFNYGLNSGIRRCYISGWKCVRVRATGNRYYSNNVLVSGNVGVGTTAPDAKLVVTGDGGGTAKIGSAGFGSNYTGISLNGTLNTVSYNFLSSTNDNHLYINRPTGNDIYFRLANNDQVAIKSSGNVGIGTADPDTPLGGAKGFVINSGAGNDVQIRLQNNTTGSGGTDGGLLSISGSLMYLWNYENSDLIFGTNSTERARILSNGNVGIGTTAPDSKLDVRTSGSNGTFGRGRAGNLNLQNTNTSVTQGGWLSISGYMGNSAPNYEMGMITGGKDTSAGDNNYAGHLSFWTCSGGANGEANSGSYERMRINGAGNVGIGTTAPAAKLQVSGAAIQGQGLLNVFNNYGSGGVVYSAAKFRNEYGNHSFGIVSEFITGAAAGTDRPSILFYSDSSAHSWQVGQVTSGWGSNDSFGIGYRANNLPNTFNTWPTSYFTILTSGNVGIGTTGPAEKLSVVGNIRSAGNVIASVGLGYGNYISMRHDDVNGYITITRTVYAGNLILEPYANVGISTTNPSYKLDVNGAIRSYSGLISNGYHSDTYIENLLPAANNGAAQGDVQLRMWCSEPGITWSWAGFGYNVRNDGASPYGFGRVNTSFGQAYMRMSTDGDWFFYNANTSGTRVTTMTLTNAGNVGIGTTGPGYKLDVSGTIRATGDVIAYSDARVKENVETLDGALDKVMKMRGVSYNKIGEQEKKVGVIAQEILEVLPEVVSQDETGTYSVAYGNISAVLIEALKELTNTVKEQQKQIDELKSKLK